MLAGVALRNLWLSKRRTLLLGTAIALVTMLLVLLMSLSTGLFETIVRSSSILLSGDVNVAGFYKAKPTDRNPMISDRAKLLSIVESNVEGIDYVIDRHRGFATLISDVDSLRSVLAGIRVEGESHLLEQLELAPKSAYVEGGGDAVEGDPKGLAREGTIMLFASQAERLGVQVGDRLTLTAQLVGGTVNTVDVELVAVTEDLGFLSSWNAFVNQRTLQKLYRVSDDTTGAIMIYLEDRARADAVMNDLRAVLEGEGYRLMDHSPQPFFVKFEAVAGEDWTGMKLDLTTWRDEMAPLEWTLNAIDTVSAVLIVILMVIIVVGIMNTMWIAVRERTQEIGTLRAIGMGQGQVLRLFIYEAALLGLGATIVGGILGWGIATAIDVAEIRLHNEAMRAVLLSDVIHLAVRPEQVLGAIGGFSLVTAAAALWPAIRAAKMQPVTAMHHVG